MENKESKTDLANSGRPDGAGSPNNNRRPGWIEILKILTWIVVVCAIGLFAVNQFFAFHYKAEFLKAPCKLCAELNPGVQECIEDLNSPRPSYPTGDGGWTDPFNESQNKIKINLTGLTP